MPEALETPKPKLLNPSSSNPSSSQRDITSQDYKNAGVLGVPNGSTMTPGEGLSSAGLRPGAYKCFALAALKPVAHTCVHMLR